jgi:hypothetical protein
MNLWQMGKRHIFPYSWHFSAWVLMCMHMAYSAVVPAWESVNLVLSVQNCCFHNVLPLLELHMLRLAIDILYKRVHKDSVPKWKVIFSFCEYWSKVAGCQWGYWNKYLSKEGRHWFLCFVEGNLESILQRDEVCNYTSVHAVCPICAKASPITPHPCNWRQEKFLE